MQIDIHNKQERMALLQRFRDTETTVAEESMLTDYFKRHEPDDDERDVALLLHTFSNVHGFETSAEEDLGSAYEAVVNSRRKDHRRTMWLWLTGVAAAVFLVFVLERHAMDMENRDGIKPLAMQIRSISNATTPSSRDSVMRPVAEKDSVAMPIRPRKARKTLQEKEQEKREKAIKRRLTTPEMIGQIRYLAEIALQDDESIEIRPIGKAALVSSTAEPAGRVYLAFPLDDEGNMELLAFENE